MPFPRLIRSLFRAVAQPPTADQDLPGPEAIKERGWRQWSCVACDDMPQVLDGAPHGADGARLLVVTQSCDLVHESYENEPVVETFLCEPLGPDHQPDGNFTAGKNPRSLLIQIPIEGTDHWFRLRSNGRALVPRHRLARIDPDPLVVVTDKTERTLQRWLINRMMRTAFPDVFNDRTQRARNKLESRLKKGGASLLGLYINLTPWKELPGTNPMRSISWGWWMKGWLWSNARPSTGCSARLRLPMTRARVSHAAITRCSTKTRPPCACCAPTASFPWIS